MSNKKKSPEHDQPSEHKHGQTEKESTNRHVYIEPGAQIDIVDSLKKQHKAERVEDKTQADKQLAWTIIGAGLVGLYTLVMFWQGCSSQKAAIAAKDAAVIANRALNLSTRAYIYTGVAYPKFTDDAAMLYIPLTNEGHIPSGEIEFAAHQITAEPATFPPRNDSLKVVSHSCYTFRYPPNPPGSFYTIHMPIDKGSLTKLTNESQVFYVAGYISYADGFEEDGIQKWPVCIQTFWVVPEKRPFMATCDIRTMLPKMEAYNDKCKDIDKGE